MSVDEVLRVRTASFGYDSELVVGPIELTIRRGEVVALLGSNGSGKSTLVKGILGIVPKLSGAIELFGIDTDRPASRRRVGYVPQRNALGAGMPATVGEVVSSGLVGAGRARRAGGRGQRRQAVCEALRRVGLADTQRRSVSELSGGQQRRVMIARAIVSDPDLWLLDEPTAGVDVEHQSLLAETLALAADRGSTVLLVAHELGPAASVVSRSIVLDRGRIGYDGPPLPDHRHHDCGGEFHHEHGDDPPSEALLGGW